MQYIKRNLGSYNLHMIKTDRFRSIDIEVILSDIVKKEEITKRNLLSKILIYSNEIYKTQYDYSNAMQDLYGLNIATSNYRLGNYYNTDFNLTMLEEQYTEPETVEKSIEFLANTIFKPNIKENAFENSTFKIVKSKMRNSIEKVKENSIKYSIIRMLENMDKNSNISLQAYGYKEDIDNITEENLYDYYLSFMNTCNIDIYIIGNFDFKDMEKIIKEKFKFKVLKKPKKEVYIKHQFKNNKIKSIIEDYPTEQANLSIGCKIHDLTEFEKNYCLSIYTIILGGSGMDSKLFKTIRKEHSLCYRVSSQANKLDNLLTITAGIDKENFNTTVDLIKKELNNMKKKNITEEELNKAKSIYISAIDEVFDNPTQIIASYYAMELLKADDPETRKEKIKKVTIDDVAELANKIAIDTIFLLGGK